jgi:hypothetical protein
MSEEVFIAAILHNIAEIVLWWVAPQEARRIRRLMQVFEMTPDEAQLHVLGFRLTELRSSLMAFWQIPEALSVLMEASHAEWPRVKFILLSTSIAGHAANGWNSPALAADIEALSAIMKMTPDNTATLVHVNAAIAGRACAWFGVAPAAAWLPMLPEGGVPEPSEDDDLASFDPIEAHVSEMLLLVPQPAILKKVMDEIGRHLDGTLKFQQLMALSLKGMHEGIGLERVVFALLAQDHGTVKAKFILGASANSPLKNFRFSLTDNCLFAKLMSKTQSVWLHSGNRPNLEKLVSSSMQQITGGEDFFAMSIFVHDKPVGLFYADKQGGAEKLTDPAYQDFKQLCLRTAQGLAHLRV